MGTSATPAASAAQQAAQQQQLNLMNRQLILQTGVSVKRQLPPQTVNPAQNPVIQFNAQNFGLLKSFYIPFKATIQNNDTANTLTLTDFGISNLFSRTTFTDLNQYLRVNTDQKHLDMRASVYYGRPFLRANALTTNRMANYGDNFATITSPATIAPSTSATINGYVEIPVTMDHANLTGAILMAATTVNATVTLTVNPQPFAAANTDTTNAIYSGTTNAVITSVTVSPYQMAIDQLPVDSKGNYIIPALDVSTVYELLASQAGGQITAGVENPYLYAPFRKFLTTIMIYDNDTNASTGRQTGQDINYFALRAANAYEFWKVDAITQASFGKRAMGDDLPAGCYLFDYRGMPINTISYGNIALFTNPSVATAPSMTLYQEDLYEPNTVMQATTVA